ncbi:hypothetical protein [Amycolatopsis sp. NPDC051061]|uniref:hypothetical protein n=1 Tax=Amycolatopsis sp. NPDC051061 TaxID=3155042 RepID=UPI00343E5BBE
MADVDPLLCGQGQSSDQGCIGFCGVYLARADVVYPGHDDPFTLEAGTPGKDLPA